MARVLNGLFRGRVGNMVFTVRDGKQFVRTVSEKYKPPVSENFRRSTTAFSLSSGLSSAIHKIKVFSDAWRRSKINAHSSYNKIMKVNLPRINTSVDLSNISLVDGNIQSFSVLKNFIFSPGEISCIINTQKAPYFTKYASIQGVVYLFDPNDKRDKKNFEFVHFTGRNIEFAPGIDINYCAGFSSQQSEIIKSFNSRKIFFNIAFKNLQGEVEGFSEMMESS
jgi:hypothetical protein